MGETIINAVVSIFESNNNHYPEHIFLCDLVTEMK